MFILKLTCFTIYWSETNILPWKSMVGSDEDSFWDSTYFQGCSLLVSGAVDSEKVGMIGNLGWVLEGSKKSLVWILFSWCLILSTLRFMKSDHLIRTYLGNTFSHHGRTRKSKFKIPLFTTGFIHPRWRRFSSINNTTMVGVEQFYDSSTKWDEEKRRSTNITCY